MLKRTIIHIWVDDARPQHTTSVFVPLHARMFMSDYIAKSWLVPLQSVLKVSPKKVNTVT